MNTILRPLFFRLIVRPVVLVLLGLNVRHRERLPQSGPAIIVANHNSHLDTLVLMSLLPMRLLPVLHPVAAMEYFLRNRYLAWFSLHIIGIIPLQRGARNTHVDPLAGCSAALKDNNILILFPEGSRGEPESPAAFKSGIAHLAQRHPEIPVIPIFLHGLGKALPRGEALLVPFFCDVFVGEALFWTGDRHDFMGKLETSIQLLAQEGNYARWD